MGFSDPFEKFRSTVSEDEAGDLRIVIPSRLSWFQLLFFAFWLSIWLIPEIGFAVGSIYGPKKAIMIFWLVYFTLMGSLAIFSLLWCGIGREVILIDDLRLQLFWQLGKFGTSKTYELVFVQDIRFFPDPRIRFPTQGSLGDMCRRLGLGGTTIAFDYETKIHRFGLNISEREARRLILVIRQRFKFPEELEPLPIQY